MEDGIIIESDDEMEENNFLEFNINFQNKRSVNIDICIYLIDGFDVYINQILNIVLGED